MLGRSTVAFSSLSHKPKLIEEGLPGIDGLCRVGLVFHKGGLQVFAGRIDLAGRANFLFMEDGGSKTM